MALASTLLILAADWGPALVPAVRQALQRSTPVEGSPAAGVSAWGESDHWLTTARAVPPAGQWRLDGAGHLLPDERTRARLEWCWSRHLGATPLPAPDQCFEGLEDAESDALLMAERVWQQYHAWQDWLREQELDLMLPELWAQQQRNRRLMRRRLFEPAWADALFGGHERRWERVLDTWAMEAGTEPSPASGGSQQALPSALRREQALTYAVALSHDALWSLEDRRSLLLRWMQDHIPPVERDSLWRQMDEVLTSGSREGEPAPAAGLPGVSAPTTGSLTSPPKPSETRRVWLRGLSARQR